MYKCHTINRPVKYRGYAETSVCELWPVTIVIVWCMSWDLNLATPVVLVSRKLYSVATVCMQLM